MANVANVTTVKNKAKFQNEKNMTRNNCNKYKTGKRVNSTNVKIVKNFEKFTNVTYICDKFNNVAIV